MGFWYYSHSHKNIPLNVSCDVSSRAVCLNVNLSIHLHSYFVYASSVGSTDSVLACPNQIIAFSALHIGNL